MSADALYVHIRVAWQSFANMMLHMVLHVASFSGEQKSEGCF